MATPITSSVIITIYKNYDALLLILAALQKQSTASFEVIIAEDNDSEYCKNLVATANYKYKLLHVNQVDDGFRKCAILNKAVKAATTDYIIFLDGDCIPHKHFVIQHYLSRQNHSALFGRRVMLSEKLSNKIVATKSLALLQSPINFIYFLWYGCNRIDAAFYLPFLKPKPKISIWGCNWSIHKQLLYTVGGFDEAYILPGIGEDVDITHRLLQLGVKIYQIKFKAVQYHLWHKVNYTNTTEVEAMLQQKMDSGVWMTKKYLP
jgi:glycosyltransferase involved in cell wall biosynthesis